MSLRVLSSRKMGKANGSRGHEDKLGYRYHLKDTPYFLKSGVQVRRYSCNNDKKPPSGVKCRGSCVVYVDKTGSKSERPGKEHNVACREKLVSAQQTKKSETVQLRNQIFKKIKENPCQKTKAIYDDVTGSADLSVSLNLPWKQIERQARRIKSGVKKEKITLPDLNDVETIEELGAYFLEAEKEDRKMEFEIGETASNKISREKPKKRTSLKTSAKRQPEKKKVLEKDNKEQEYEIGAKSGLKLILARKE